MCPSSKEWHAKASSGKSRELDNISLSRLHLSLLPSLKALLDTCSVTSAAQLLCVTQPTMSRNLAQLRESLCDPILVRSAGRTELSERAKEIHSQVNRLVVDAATIFENASFDPQTTNRHFHIIGNHVMVEQILPQVLCELREVAPNFTFDVDLLNDHTLKKLQRGEVDLAVGMSGQPAAGVRSHEFLRSRLACMMSATHPLAQRTFTMEELHDYPILLLKSGFCTALPIQAFYEEEGFVPRMTISSISAALTILAGSDYICFHASVYQQLDERLVIRSIPDKQIEVDSRIAWPEYWNANRSHRWLRDYIFQSMQRIFTDEKMQSSSNQFSLVR